MIIKRALSNIDTLKALGPFSRFTSRQLPGRFFCLMQNRALLRLPHSRVILPTGKAQAGSLAHAWRLGRSCHMGRSAADFGSFRSYGLAFIYTSKKPGIMSGRPAHEYRTSFFDLTKIEPALKMQPSSGGCALPQRMLLTIFAWKQWAARLARLSQFIALVPCASTLAYRRRAATWHDMPSREP